MLNSAATRAAAAARRAAASAGRGASALKNKVKRAAGGSDRVEIAEQRYGRLDLSDELDDTEPAPEWKPRRLDGVEAHKGPPQYFTG